MHRVPQHSMLMKTDLQPPTGLPEDTLLRSKRRWVRRRILQSADSCVWELLAVGVCVYL